MDCEYFPLPVAPIHVNSIKLNRSLYNERLRKDVIICGHCGLLAFGFQSTKDCERYCSCVLYWQALYL